MHRRTPRKTVLAQNYLQVTDGGGKDYVRESIRKGPHILFAHLPEGTEPYNIILSFVWI